jgi:hypothetical protein
LTAKIGVADEVTRQGSTPPLDPNRSRSRSEIREDFVPLGDTIRQSIVLPRATLAPRLKFRSRAASPDVPETLPTCALPRPNFLERYMQFQAHQPLFLADEPLFPAHRPLFLAHGPKFQAHRPKFPAYEPLFLAYATLFRTHRAKFPAHGALFLPDSTKFPEHCMKFPAHSTKFPAGRFALPYRLPTFLLTNHLFLPGLASAPLIAHSRMADR